MIRLNALARFRDAKLTTTIQGANAEYLTMRGLEVAEGRPLTDDDVQGVARVAVIGQTVLDELFPRIRIRSINLSGSTMCRFA